MKSVLAEAALFLFLACACSGATLMAQEMPVTPIPEDDFAAVSPKEGWNDFDLVEEEPQLPWYSQALLWLPNRFLDLVDVFRVDVGAGPAYGAVARITRYGQVGYRDFAPTSLRIGFFGREAPFMLERSSEYGIGPAYVDSKDRVICKGEFGVGADLFLIGAYGGICVEELADFVAGIFFLDVMDDDLK